MNAYNWDAIGSLAEFFGAIGVFLSLIYLAIQMKRNASETRDASILSVMELTIQFRAESYKGDLADIRLKVANNETLSAIEALKFEGYLSALFELTELVFVQYQKDNLDPEYFNAWEIRTSAAISTTPVQRFWAKTRIAYRQSFVEYIDGLLEQSTR